jgi:nitrite reductase (NADH) large subunit
MKREPFATLHRRPRLVVVGNGMAGVRAIEHLLELAPDLYDITVFGAEPHPNYNRILLSPVLAGEQTLADIVLNDAGWSRPTGSRCISARRSSASTVRAASSRPRTARAPITTGCSSPPARTR